MPETKVRVRFAPSPTGDPHIGSMWAALFNYIYARQQHGSFILRIEDTDQKRLVAGSVQAINDALAWLGLPPDEGPDQGGNFGPYIQSQRLAIYQQHVMMLLESGNAYYCFCTTGRLEELRQQQATAKLAPRYDKRCATVDVAEARRRVAAGEHTVIRLKVPKSGQVVHHDLIRGDVTFSWAEIDDSVLLKSDGYPTYHLANVVDDHLMAISHVIRAEEWLPSTPKHLLLYQAFGWTPPVFAHLPQLLGTDRSKLSKRHGATAALSFRNEGYLPEAMRNFFVLMGWHPKGDDEILTDERVQAEFSLSDVNPAGAIFDRVKLDWMNGHYIRSLNLDELVRRALPFWPMAREEKVDALRLQALISLVRERIKRLNEIEDLTSFGFSSAWNKNLATFDRNLIIPKQGTIDTAREVLLWLTQLLPEFSKSWSAQELKKKTLLAIAGSGRENGDVLWPARVALTLRPASPDVFDVMQFLGLKEVMRRLQKIIQD